MTTARRFALALAGAATAAAISGCGGDGLGELSTGTPSESTSSTSSEHGHEELHVEPTTAAPKLQDPIAAAEKFLKTWSRPSLSYAQWWADLEPLLNPQGQQAYSYTDPSVVPALKITGRPRLEKSTVSTSSTVWLPTDQGTFGVRLSRTGPQAAWLASRIYFPKAQ